ncbi:Variant-specific surface protein, partial [Giardia duodenalis]
VRRDDRGKTYCSKCTGDKVPIDGECKAKNGEADKCTAGTGDKAGTCTACTNPYYLYKGGCYTACPQGTQKNESKHTCDEVAPAGCNTPNCKACDNPKTDNEVCTDCDGSTYLTPTSQCIDSCAKVGNYYGATEGAKKLCKECTAANCKTCDGQGQCQTCNNGFYKNGDACSPCHESCKTCSAGTASDCTECPTGKALRYGDDGTKGTCGEGCTTGQGSGACKTCGLTIDGASYCSECATATEYPQNGICTSTTARAAATCKAGSVANGICSLCTNGFLRMNGGCYETTKFPGKSVCEEAASAGDTCQTPADGYKLNNGALITCSAGCKTCTSNTVCTACMEGYVKTSDSCAKCATGCATCTGSASNCDICSTGYYKYKNACVSCTANTADGTITGVANCASCAPPSNNQGSVLCYLIKDSGSTNKSGLSAGAIAGISVAVIVVVGGLVGFLCWWFLCRGKA